MISFKSRKLWTIVGFVGAFALVGRSLFFEFAHHSTSKHAFVTLITNDNYAKGMRCSCEGVFLLMVFFRCHCVGEISFSTASTRHSEHYLSRHIVSHWNNSRAIAKTSLSRTTSRLDCQSAQQQSAICRHVYKTQRMETCRLSSCVIDGCRYNCFETNWRSFSHWTESRRRCCCRWLVSYIFYSFLLSSYLWNTMSKVAIISIRA